MMEANNDKDIGMTTKSFYNSKPKQSEKTDSNRRRDTKRSEQIKRRLESACEQVKIRRVCDLFLNRNLEHRSLIGETGDPAQEVPSVYRVFQKQADALDFAVNLPALKVFAFELDSKGRRHFVACHPGTLWRLLNAKSAEDRHCYEVIGEDAASKIYFDLEYKVKGNEAVDGNRMLTDFKAILEKDLTKVFAKAGLNKINLIDLESSTEDKFSHHIIVNMYNAKGEAMLLPNNRDVGLYARRLCKKMREAGDLGDLERGGRGGRGRFLLDVPKDSLFVDEGVYTKNRNFRTLLSSKFGKKPAAILKPSAIENNAVTSVTKLRSIFFKSLVTYAEVSTMVCLHQQEVGVGGLGGRDQAEVGTASKPKRPRPTASSTSAFPEIDSHILGIVNKEGGYIRKVTPSPCGWFLLYDLGGYRNCANVGRWHKSNNVKFVVDLKVNKMCQACHDPDCKDFRSDFWELPETCAIPWQNIFENEDEDENLQDNQQSKSADGSSWEKFCPENEHEAAEVEATLVEAVVEMEEEAFLLEAAKDF